MFIARGIFPADYMYLKLEHHVKECIWEPLYIIIVVDYRIIEYDTDIRH